ncbi:MAG TPA: hypothetical protein DCS82_00695 [Rhodospirillaceae bacterium]|nr:hypothetical protein [Rhodospirillaceae bacterium]
MADTTPKSKPIRPAFAFLFLILCGLLWGSNITVGRAVHDEFSAVALAFFRNATAMVVLLIILRRQWHLLVPAYKAHWRIILPAGVIGTALFNVTLYTSVQTTTAVNAGIAMSLTPAVVPVIAYFLLGSLFTLRQAVGVVVSFIGVGVVLARGNIEVLTTLSITEGDLIAIGAMICWSYYSVLVKKRPDDLAPNLFLVALLICAVVSLLPFFVAEAISGTVLPENRQSLLAAAYVGIFPTLVALFLFNRAIDSVGPNVAGHFQHAVPLFAALLGILFLGERLALYHGIAAALIAAGIYWATSSAKTK